MKEVGQESGYHDKERNVLLGTPASIPNPREKKIAPLSTMGNDTEQKAEGEE